MKLAEYLNHLSQKKTKPVSEFVQEPKHLKSQSNIDDSAKTMSDYFANLPPLKPATGHIKLLEDEFFRNKNIPNREKNKSRIISLLDKSKRNIATKQEIIELENLIHQN